MKQLTTKIICDLLSVGSIVREATTLKQASNCVRRLTGESNEHIDYVLERIMRDSKSYQRFVALITMDDNTERFSKSYPGETLEEFKARIEGLYNNHKVDIEYSSYIPQL